MNLKWGCPGQGQVETHLGDVQPWQVMYEDIWILDEDTGLVYQGISSEGTGNMLNEVRAYLETT